jgi:DNA-binding SARP family transcriptional activator
MINTPNIVLIGGSSNQVKRIKTVASEKFVILELQADSLQQLPSIEGLSKETLIFLFEGSTQKTLHQIHRLKEGFPGIPVIIAGRRPTRKSIISAFRQGADDFLIWPAEEKEILNLLERYKPSTRGRINRILRRWLRKFKTTLGQSARAERRPHARAETLGIFANLPFTSGIANDTSDQADLSIRFFGRFEIYFRGKKMKPIPGKKVTSLFAYLLYHHSKPLHREKLMAQFWGNNTPSSARNSLNVAIHAIRKHFDKICPHQELILYNRETYVLNPELDILTDVEQFVHYWQRGRDIEARQGLESAMGAFNKAVALYRGDFLEDMLYEEWCESERDSLMETYLLTLDRMSSYFLNEGSYTASINLCKKILEKDDCLEDGHRRLIICYDRLGMRDKAIRQYHKCARILKNELSVEPSDETKEIFVEISEG